MRPLINWKFIDNSVLPTENGASLSVLGGEVMNIEITSSGTFSLTVEGMVSSKWTTIGMVVDLASGNIVSNLTDQSHVYQLELNGWEKIRINMSSNTGTTTVVGKVVGS